MEINKFCTKCQQYKPLSAFSKNRAKQDGLCSYCKECNRAYYKQYRAKRVADGVCRECGKPAKPGITLCQDCMDKVVARTGAHRRAHPLQRAVSRARRRAKRLGIPFDITVSDLEPLPTHCPALGIKLNYNYVNAKGKPGPRPDSPSLDRIIPERGYVPGNVAVISNKANAMKQDATSTELFLVAEWVRENETN